MIKDIIKDEAVLSTPCEPATEQDASIAQDLIDTIASNEDAAALAANQIGCTKRIVAYRADDDSVHVLFNPVLKQALHPFDAMEACLSRDEETKVKRFGWIKVSYDELVDGKLVAKKRAFEGWNAQLIQHMIDHCKGKLV